MLVLLLGFVVGLVLGSFSKACADRISSNKTIWGRSYCLSCKKSLAWYDLFPFFSYLFLQGKCRYCHKAIPLQVWLAETAVGVMMALLFYFTLPQSLESLTALDFSSALLFLTLVFKCFVVVVLTILFFVDLKVGLLPDKITLPSSVVAFVYIIVSYSLRSWIFYQALLKNPLAPYLLPPKTNYLYLHLLNIWMPAIWTVGIALLLAGLFLLLIIVTRGRGMGGGDVKYVLFLGLALGFPESLAGVFLAFGLGSIVAILLIVMRKRQFGQTVPFGPFLSLGAYIALIFGNQIINWYLTSFKI